MNRLLHALGTVLLVCLGVRLAAWLVEPVLPLLGGLLIVAAVGMWLLSGRGSGPGGYH